MAARRKEGVRRHLSCRSALPGALVARPRCTEVSHVRCLVCRCHARASEVWWSHPRPPTRWQARVRFPLSGQTRLKLRCRQVRSTWAARDTWARLGGSFIRRILRGSVCRTRAICWPRAPECSMSEFVNSGAHRTRAPNARQTENTKMGSMAATHERHASGARSEGCHQRNDDAIAHVAAEAPEDTIPDRNQIARMTLMITTGIGAFLN